MFVRPKLRPSHSVVQIAVVPQLMACWPCCWRPVPDADVHVGHNTLEREQLHRD